MELPQLIVGLDSLNEDSNYVHINDVRENITYYCPCCKGVIKPRAYKKDHNYQVQPHFYHESGGCNEETFVHYICKNWLFEKGCKFIVSGTKYQVESIETEKTLYTSFGDYRPDIIATTDTGKVFYFEIKVTNKKTEHYIPKWDELGNDVVEVDARYFINQKYKNDIPVFELIYSDGKCFIKSYSRTDYEDTIAKRKLEWERQDKLNYKMQWERLDWFWVELQKYKADKSTIDDVIQLFSLMDYTDMIWCYLNITGKSCASNKDDFIKLINGNFLEQVERLLLENISESKYDIILTHKSPLVYFLQIKVFINYLDYECHESVEIKLKTTKGIFISEYFDSIESELAILTKRWQQAQLDVLKILNLTTLKYIQKIVPHSHSAAKYYDFHNLFFKVIFVDNINSRNFPEIIGEFECKSCNIFESALYSKYKSYLEDANDCLYNTFIKHALKNNSTYLESLNKLRVVCNNSGNFELKVSKDFRRVWILYFNKELFSYEFGNDDTFDKFGEKVLNLACNIIKETTEKAELVNMYINKVNNCKNKKWKIEPLSRNHDLCLWYINNGKKENYIVIHLYPIQYKTIPFEEYVKNEIFNAMKELVVDGSYGVRIMEE